MDRLMMNRTAHTGLLLALGVLLFAGCPLFQDPASPPFLDRVEAVRSLSDDEVVLGADITEMRVVNTGRREFLLLNVPTADGRRLLVLNADLSRASIAVDPDGILTAFPIGYDAGFIVGEKRFDSAGEIDTAFLSVFTDDTLSAEKGAIGATSEIIRFGIEATTFADMRFGPVYEDTNGFQTAVTPETIVDWTILLEAADAEGASPEPRGEFRLASFSAVPAENEAEGVARIVLSNQQEYWQGELSFSDISQILATAPGDPVDIEGNEYEYLLELPAFTRLREVEDEPQFVVAPDVVLAMGSDSHRVFSRETGAVIAERVVPQDEFIRYAYSPSGEHLYMLDLARRRVYRVSAWW